MLKRWRSGSAEEQAPDPMRGADDVEGDGSAGAGDGATSGGEADAARWLAAAAAAAAETLERVVMHSGDDGMPYELLTLSEVRAMGQFM